MSTPWCPEEVATLQRLRRAGLPVKACRRHLPCRSIQAIYDKAHRDGLPGILAVRKEVLLPLIREERRRGVPCTVLAERLGLSPMTLWRWLREDEA